MRFFARRKWLFKLLFVPTQLFIKKLFVFNHTFHGFLHFIQRLISFEYLCSNFMTLIYKIRLIHSRCGWLSKHCATFWILKSFRFVFEVKVVVPSATVYYWLIWWVRFPLLLNHHFQIKSLIGNFAWVVSIIIILFMTKFVVSTAIIC